jgi:hypothetical protein
MGWLAWYKKTCDTGTGPPETMGWLVWYKKTCDTGTGSPGSKDRQAGYRKITLVLDWRACKHVLKSLVQKKDKRC